MLLRVAILLISAGAIAYEILLMRILSVVQWHHFAAMIISLALLGYGTSGTLLTLGRRWLERESSTSAAGGDGRWRRVLPALAALFGFLAPLCLMLAQRIPFNPLAVVWEPRQLGSLAQLYLLLALPFLCAAACIGLALTFGGDEIPKIYRADLVGAGLGAAVGLGTMFVMPLTACLKSVGALGFLAAAVAGWGLQGGPRRWLLSVFVAGSLGSLLLWPQSWLDLRVSEYKALQKTLLIPDTEVIGERSSPLGLLTVVASPTIPFREAPGLSLAFDGDLPEQLGVFTDGDSLSVIDGAAESSNATEYLGYRTAALPYRLLDRPSVLVLGSGGGREVVAALKAGAQRVDAVEYNPQMAGLVLHDFAAFAGDPYRHGSVYLHVDEARSFIRRSERKFDLIQVALTESQAATSGGTQAVSASYLYTVESFVDMISRLEPGGLLALTRWLRLPPRENLKLFGTAIRALASLGVGEPARRLVQIRSWGTVTTIVKNGDLSAGEVEAVRRFCDRLFFDPTFYPGMQRTEANRFNRLEHPFLYDGARSLLRDAESFADSYKFNIRPATDDRPFFYHTFKWAALPELLALTRRTGTSLVEWGYLILFATVVQALLAGFVLILLPLRAVTSRRRQGGTGSVLVYFAALGLAFLLMEISFIQRFGLYLGHPIYSVAVVLVSFLVFAGLGSGYSRSIVTRPGSWRLSPWRVTLLITALSLIYLFALPVAMRATLAWPASVRIMLTLIVLAPLAFLMGLPFPMGLTRAAEMRSSWVPWAWGINGCASVVSAAAAPLLAIHFGFSSVVVMAASCYLLAGLSSRRALYPVGWNSERIL